MALDVLICNPEKLGVRAFLVAFLVAIISVANGFMTSGSRFRVSQLLESAFVQPNSNCPPKLLVISTH